MVYLLVIVTFIYNLWKKLEINLMLTWKLEYTITKDTIVMEATFAIIGIIGTSDPTDIVNKVNFYSNTYFRELKKSTFPMGNFP